MYEEGECTLTNVQIRFFFGTLGLFFSPVRESFTFDSVLSSWRNGGRGSLIWGFHDKIPDTPIPCLMRFAVFHLLFLSKSTVLWILTRIVAVSLQIRWYRRSFHVKDVNFSGMNHSGRRKTDNEHPWDMWIRKNVLISRSKVTSEQAHHNTEYKTLLKLCLYYRLSVSTTELCLYICIEFRSTCTWNIGHAGCHLHLAISTSPTKASVYKRRFFLNRSISIWKTGERRHGRLLRRCDSTPQWPMVHMWYFVHSIKEATRFRLFDAIREPFNARKALPEWSKRDLGWELNQKAKVFA